MGNNQFVKEKIAFYNQKKDFMELKDRELKDRKEKMKWTSLKKKK